MQIPPFPQFNKIKEAGKAGIYFTGLGFDLLQSNVGIHGFIVVTDPSFYSLIKSSKYLQSNWESADIHEVLFSEDSLKPFLAPGHMMPCSATSLLQALSFFDMYVEKNGKCLPTNQSIIQVVDD